MKQKIKITKTKEWIEVNMGAFIIFPRNLDELKKLSKKIIEYINKNENC